MSPASSAELFLYRGDQHDFADTWLPSYDPQPTALLTRQVLDFLGRVSAGDGIPDERPAAAPLSNRPA